MRELIPKAEWGPGPWQDEPDRAEWRAAAGLPAMAIRNTHTSGSWCGYVAVAPGHPFYGKHYGQCLRKNCKKAKLTAKQQLNHSRMKRERAKGAEERRWAEMSIRMNEMFVRWEKQGHYGKSSPCSHYDARPEGILEVHGGITYSNACHGDICHIPREGEPHEVWWFGFDCAHSGDVSPLMDKTLNDLMPERAESLRGYGESYKDLAYVKDEVESLALQLATIGEAGRYDVLAELRR